MKIMEFSRDYIFVWKLIFLFSFKAHFFRDHFCEKSTAYTECISSIKSSQPPIYRPIGCWKNKTLKKMSLIILTDKKEQEEITKVHKEHTSQA